MRRSLPLLLFFLSLPVIAGAQAPVGTQTPAEDKVPTWDHNFYLGMAGMVEMSANSQVPGYGSGSGFAMVGGYSFDKNLALQVQLDHFYFYGPDSKYVYRFRPVAGVKLSLDLQDSFRPFVFLGSGMNLNVAYVPYQVSTSLAFILSMGAGVQLDLGEFSLYAEGEYDYLFRDYAATDSPLMQSIPLEIGFLHPL